MTPDEFLTYMRARPDFEEHDTVLGGFWSEPFRMMVSLSDDTVSVTIPLACGRPLFSQFHVRSARASNDGGVCFDLCHEVIPPRPEVVIARAEHCILKHEAEAAVAELIGGKNASEA